MTGSSTFNAEIEPKWLELLKEIAPRDHDDCCSS